MNRKLELARECLREMNADGWLLYDFYRTNDLAHRFLEIPESRKATRRFFYWIPVQGEPVQIVHAIEPEALLPWPGVRRVYLSWQSLHAELQRALKGARRVAMEVSSNPYLSKVDAGTVDLIRSFGVFVAGSGSFLQRFTAVLSEEQAGSARRAGIALDAIVEEAWKLIAHRLRNREPVGERAVQQWIAEEFGRRNLVTEDAPIVAVDRHSADPHHSSGDTRIADGSWVLIDLWAKETGEGAVFADITRVGVAADAPTARQEEIFSFVRNAQREATEFVRKRFREKAPVQGWEVDESARRVIRDAGYGEQFLHRTGHSIETHLHGSGAHMDNLELRDDRTLLPGTCCSIEPGIYLEGEFGVRLEYDLYIHPSGSVEIIGGEQDRIAIIR